MENHKNNRGIIVLLIVIIIMLSVTCVLFANGTIVFKSNKVDNNNQNNNSNLPEWANYLLEQNITEIIYKNGTLTNTEECMPAKALTKDQLTSILLKMTSSKLKKFDAGGFGGPCWGGIVVKYNNNKEFRIFMSKFIVIEDNDSYILSLLEKEDYTLDSQRYDQPLWVYEYDWDTSYVEKLF